MKKLKNRSLFAGLVFLNSDSLEKLYRFKEIVSSRYGSCHLGNSDLVNFLLSTFDLEKFNSAFSRVMSEEDSE